MSCLLEGLDQHDGGAAKFNGTEMKADVYPCEQISALPTAILLFNVKPRNTTGRRMGG
jgi:hypothetical protein